MNETEKIKNLLIKTYWQTLVTKFIILTEMKRDRTKELITRLFDALNTSMAKNCYKIFSRIARANKLQKRKIFDESLLKILIFIKNEIISFKNLCSYILCTYILYLKISMLF